MREFSTKDIRVGTTASNAGVAQAAFQGNAATRTADRPSPARHRRRRPSPVWSLVARALLQRRRLQVELASPPPLQSAGLMWLLLRPMHESVDAALHGYISHSALYC